MTRLPPLSAVKMLSCAVSLTVAVFAFPAQSQTAQPADQSTPATPAASDKNSPANTENNNAAEPAANAPDPASQTAPAASSDQDYIDIAPQEVPREINEFKLTEDLLGKMEKIHDQLNDLQLSATEEEGADPNPSIDQMVSSIETRPKVLEVMKSHGVAPRDYVVGYFALMSSLAAVDAEHEDQLINEAVNINPDHVAFGKQFAERIRNLIGE